MNLAAHLDRSTVDWGEEPLPWRQASNLLNDAHLFRAHGLYQMPLSSTLYWYVAGRVRHIETWTPYVVISVHSEDWV